MAKEHGVEGGALWWVRRGHLVHEACGGGTKGGPDGANSGCALRVAWEPVQGPTWNEAPSVTPKEGVGEVAGGTAYVKYPWKGAWEAAWGPGSAKTRREHAVAIPGVHQVRLP